MKTVKGKIAILSVVAASLAGCIAPTAFAAGNVYITGQSVADDSGPFHGLGFTFMSAMWMCKNDRTGFQNELAYMSQRGFNFMRILSEVPGACPEDYWYGRSINCNQYKCFHGVTAYPWPDWDQQFKDCIDIAYSYGIRCEVTIFGGACESFVANQSDPWNMSNYYAREAHCQRVLNNLVGREDKIILLEVANEGNITGWAWWGGQPGMIWLRNLGAYLGARTAIPVALTAPCTPYYDSTDINTLYAGSAADLITEHFNRDMGTNQGDWLSCSDPWRVFPLLAASGEGRAISSDEPVGPGSSVAEENHPIHLCSAAAFGYTAGKLALYVFHTNAGVRHDQTFASHGEAATCAFMNLKSIIPANVQNWTRNDGLEAAAPFTVFCGSQPNAYWWYPTPYGGNDGCHTNAGSRSGNEFICYPMGIRSGGLLLQAREPMTAVAVNPLNGAILVGGVLNTGQQALLPQGPEAWVIRGTQGIAAQSPYAGVIQLPGTVQMENFDDGGEGLSYHDAYYGNTSGMYRSTHVDICASDNGYAQGWNDTGEWLEFTVNVATSGLYSMTAKWATPNNGCAIHIEMNGVNVTGSAPLPNTGGWNSWVTGTGYNIPLNAGQQIMRVYTDVGGYNLDYISVARQ
jgi:hypothetical protein